MKLCELIELTRASILRDTSTQVSGSKKDRYWGDKELAIWLNAAQRQFAVQTLSLVDDTTPSITQLRVELGKSRYKLHPLILGVTNVYIPGLGDLSMRPRADVMSVRMQQPGLPQFYHADMYTNTLMLSMMPDSQTDGRPLQLRAIRYPLVELSIDNTLVEPEIRPQYHEILVEYAAFRALRDHDAEIENIQKADAHKAYFDAVCAEVRDLPKDKAAVTDTLKAGSGWGFPGHGRGGRYFPYEGGYDV